MADAEKVSVPEVQNGPPPSKLVLAKPRLGGFGSSGFPQSDAGASGNPFGKIGSTSVLRPPQLKPVLSTNPFLRLSTGNDTETASKEEADSQERLKDTKDSKDATDPPKFVPLGGTTSVKTSNPVPTPTQPCSSSSSSGFVFGQNLSERAMVAEGVNNGTSSVDHSATNGNCELLFSNAAASKVENNQEDCAGAAGEGLAAAAAEYEQSHARQPVVTSAAASTGEESETNVLQVTCRLFAWEAGSWRERGRGVLRLNDAGGGGGGGSRLVCRVLGSLRVVLNTKVWPEMVADRASAKSLRITASDAQNHVKVFLVMATPADIVQLHRELTSRIALATAHKSSEPSVDPQRVGDQPSEGCYIDDESLGASNDGHFICDDDPRPKPEDGARPKPDDDPRHKPEENGKDDAGKDATVDDNKDNEMKEEQTKPLKRKDAEPADAAPKRLCPEIVIE